MYIVKTFLKKLCLALSRKVKVIVMKKESQLNSQGSAVSEVRTSQWSKDLNLLYNNSELLINFIVMILYTSHSLMRLHLDQRAKDFKSG